MRTSTLWLVGLLGCQPASLDYDPVTLSDELQKISTSPDTTINGTAKSELGMCVARAGDVNGDGYDDIFAAALDTSGSRQVHLFHGSSSGVDSKIQQTLAINGCPDRADVNGDGIQDLVLDSVFTSLTVHHGTSSGYSSTPSTSTKRSTWPLFGTAPLADVDGDGDDELLCSDGALYKGGPKGLSSTRSHFRTRTSYSERFIGGDFNGDGYGDVAWLDPNGGMACSARSGSTLLELHSGVVAIYYGSASGLGKPIEVLWGSCLAGTGVVNADAFDGAISNSADVNGDGRDDLIVGIQEQEKTTAGTTLGDRTAHLFLSSSSGFSTTGVQLPKPTVAPRGFGAGSIGDTNADGYADFILGDNQTEAAWLYLGSSAGVASNPQKLSSSWDLWVSGAGDVNGDGWSDVVIADSSATSNAGKLELYHGLGGTGTDDDGDGYADSVDCDDDDASVHPFATEVIGNEIDDDCDGVEYCFMDRDGDGARGTAWLVSTDDDCADVGELSDTADVDCNDKDANTYPGATESVGDQVDRDCDGEVLCFVDSDGDGARTGTSVVSTDPDCRDAGEALAIAPLDCDDEDAARSPDFPEVIDNGIDDNCDRDEICYADADGDGARSEQQVISTDLDCDDPGESGPAAELDCDDTNDARFPSATEIVGNERDEDCDGGELCFVDSDEDGFRTTAVVATTFVTCNQPGEANADAALDCDDSDPATFPGAPEAVGDEVDQDCDGTEVCFADADNDGFRPDLEASIASEDLDCTDAGEALPSDPVGDCDDSQADVYPGASETVGDEVDRNCDGEVQCYEDRDYDGFRNDVPRFSYDADCADPGEANLAAPNGDCDDWDAKIYPGATEIPGDEIDQDCDGADTPATPDESGCGCRHASAPMSLFGGLLGLMLAAMRRRTRS